MNIVLIGCGSIGTVVADAMNENKVDVQLKYVYDIDVKKAVEFAKNFHTEYKDFDEILKEELDLILEAASQQAVRTLLKTLRAKKNVMIMSTRALVDEKLSFSCLHLENARFQLTRMLTVFQND